VLSSSRTSLSLDHWLPSRLKQRILTLSGTLSNPQFSSLSNQVQTVASSLVGVSNQVSTNSTSISILQTQSTWTSNQVISSLMNTSNFSNDIYPRYTFTSNQSVFANNGVVYCSNLAIYGSNSAAAAQTTANFSSNLIPTFMTSNVFYPLRSYDSNTSTWSSNQLATLNTTTNFTSFSNYVSPLATFGCNASVWCSNGLNSYSNYVSTAFAYSNPLYLYVNAHCNQTWSNTTSLSTLSNSFAAWSNLQNTTVVNMSNYTYTALTNTVYSNNLYCSNSTVFSSNTSVAALNVEIYCSNNFSNVFTSNTVFAFVNSNTNRLIFSSNSLSNYRAKSVSVPWTEVSGKPDFSSDGAGNDSLGAAGVSIGSSGLLMSGYNLLDKNGKLTNALSDAFGKMTIDPTGYFKLNDPGSYIDIGDSTTRVSKDRLLFKTGTFSNMILNPANLSYSNAIFSLCNQISLTATSISNLTHVSCS
jgi:hypothetical protein